MRLPLDMHFSLKLTLRPTAEPISFMRLAVGYYGVLVIASGGGPLRKRRSGSIDKPPQWGGKPQSQFELFKGWLEGFKNTGTYSW